VVDDVIDGVVIAELESVIVRSESALERRVTRRHRVGTKQCTYTAPPTSIFTSARLALAYLSVRPSVCMRVRMEGRCGRTVWTATRRN